MTKYILTSDRLKQMVEYDHLTGIFVWKIRRQKIGGKFAEPGDVAGFLENGYWNLRIDKKTYRAHRLAWLYHYGEWPCKDIDHKNCDRSDNKIANLRLGGKDVNPHNRKKRKDNTTGFKSVTKNRNKFMARIGVGYDRIYLGMFDTAEEAHAAYAAAARKYHGEFARAE